MVKSILNGWRIYWHRQCIFHPRTVCPACLHFLDWPPRTESSAGEEATDVVLSNSHVRLTINQGTPGEPRQWLYRAVLVALNLISQEMPSRAVKFTLLFAIIRSHPG